MNPTKTLLLAAIVLSTTACGTIDTVFREDAVASQKLKNLRSHCESVPRIYSGVVYDFCSLNGEPNTNKSLENSQINWVPWIAVDFALSGVLDTLVLPYTVYRQNRDGSIEIFR